MLSSQVLRPNRGVFGLAEWEHARLRHGLRQVTGLLSSQVLRPTHDLFGPVAMGVMRIRRLLVCEVSGEGAWGRD